MRVFLDLTLNMANTPTLGQSVLFSQKFPLAFPGRSSAPSPFRVDEGYSEEPRSQNGDELEDSIILDRDEQSAQTISARAWLHSQPVELRSGTDLQNCTNILSGTRTDIFLTQHSPGSFFYHSQMLVSQKSSAKPTSDCTLTQ